MIAPERKRLVLQWTKKAEEDFAYAQLGLAAGEGFLSGCVYHCQQAGEKSLKALHCLHGRIPPKTHDLINLIEILMPDVNLDEFQEAGLYLTPLATEFRYPGDHDEPSLRDAEVAVSYAEQFVVLARKIAKSLAVE